MSRGFVQTLTLFFPRFTFIRSQTQAALSHPESGRGRAGSGHEDGQPEASLREVQLRLYIMIHVHTQACIMGKDKHWCTFSGNKNNFKKRLNSI